MDKPSQTDKLKIGFVFDDSLDKPDGVQQYILSIGGWLDSQGHDVHYLVGKTTRTDIKNVHSLSRNVNVSFNGNHLSIPLPTSRRMLKNFLNQQQFDILHVQMPYSPWLAQRIILAAPKHCHIFATFHIVAYSKFVQLATRGLALWTKRTLPRFTEIVSVSSAAQAYAKATYGITTEVLPNVFDYDRFNSAIPLLPPLSGKLRILFLGRLVERKGCQYLLASVKELRAMGVMNFEVVVCGRGPLQAELQAYAIKHDLAVDFRGFVSEEDKPGYYASADIAVFPSTGGESFGIVLIEAMASGRSAILAASNSGYASVLAERPDLLFEPLNTQELTIKLKQLLTDTELRQNNANWGKQYSRQFDVPVVGERLMKMYLQ